MFCAFAQHGFAQSATNSVPDANPGRPTVSTPATLTPVGYLQFENGTLFAEHSPEFYIGTFQQSSLILLSDDVRGFHVDTNAIVAEQTQGAVRRAQFGQTLSISHPLGHFTISAEIWHFSQPFLPGNAVGNLWAVSYALRKNLVVDGGFDHGLTKTSTQWETFVGFTYLLPHRLWMDHHSNRRLLPSSYR